MKLTGGRGAALVATPDPVAIIVTRAGIADHPARAHVSVAAVVRIGEKALARVCLRQFETRLPVDSVQSRCAARQIANESIFVRITKRGESAAFLCPAILVESRQRLATLDGWTVFVLRAVLLHSPNEWRADTEAGPVLQRASKLPIDEARTPGVFALGSVGIRRDEAIGERLACRRFLCIKDEPSSGSDRSGRRAGLRPPGYRQGGIGASNRSTGDESRFASQGFAVTNLHLSASA